MASQDTIDRLLGFLRNHHDAHHQHKDPELDKLTQDVNKQIETSQDATSRVTDALHMLGMLDDLSPEMKWLQAHLVGMAAALIGTYEMNKAIYEELVEANASLTGIHTHLAHYFPVPENPPEHVSEHVGEVPTDGFIWDDIKQADEVPEDQAANTEDS